MKIGLIDVDGHNFPNLALMKISAFHKAQGDTVEWWNPFIITILYINARFLVIHNKLYGDDFIRYE